MILLVFTFHWWQNENQIFIWLPIFHTSNYNLTVKVCVFQPDDTHFYKRIALFLLLNLWNICPQFYLQINIEQIDKKELDAIQTDLMTFFVFFCLNVTINFLLSIIWPLLMKYNKKKIFIDFVNYFIFIA